MTDNVKNFMKTFEAKIEGAEIYLVGGAVRDMFMGREVNDYDFTTNITVDDMEKHFKCVDIGQSKDFGITSIQYGGESYEVATYRKDVGSSDGRHPDAVDFNATLKEDLARRDFTMNAMAMDVDGNVEDPFLGNLDRMNGIIRAVGVADKRIEEDALRILRAVRFAVTYGFAIEDDLNFAIIKNRESINNLSQERITQEIIKVASIGGQTFYRYFKLLEELDLVSIIFPEIEVMKDFRQYWLHHPEGGLMCPVDNPDVIVPLTIKGMESGLYNLVECGSVYAHVKSVLSMVPEEADEFVVLSALWHDIGKPITAEWKDDNTGTCSFKRHEYKGVEVFEEMAKKRKLGGILSRCIAFSVAQHMNMNNKELSKKSTILNMALNPFFDTLAEVSRADDKSRNVNGNVLYVEEEFDKNLNKFLDARENFVDTTALKAKIGEFVNGKKVMDICDIKPSKKVGAIIEEVTEFLIEEDFNVSVEEIDKMIKWLGERMEVEDAKGD